MAEIFVGFPSYECPSHTHLPCRDEEREVTSLSVGIWYRPAGCIFIYFGGHRKVGEANYMTSCGNHMTPPSRKALPASLWVTMHTGKPFKYQSIRKRWPVPPNAFLHTFPSLYIDYIPAKPFSSNNSFSTPRFHSNFLPLIFLPCTQKLPFSSLLVNSASPTKSSCPQLQLDPPYFFQELNQLQLH